MEPPLPGWEAHPRCGNLRESVERVDGKQRQALAHEQRKPESSLAKKISGFQNERGAKIGVPNDTVKEEICRIAWLDRSDHRGPAGGVA